MLYDPKWEQQTKADPFKLETLIAWLEKQPADRPYCFFDFGGRCLLAQYATAHGLAWAIAYKHLIAVPGVEDIAFETPWTFGAALERARALRSANT